MDYDVDLTNNLTKPNFKILTNKPIQIGDKIVCIGDNATCISTLITNLLMECFIIGTVTHIKRNHHSIGVSSMYDQIYAQWNMPFDINDCYDDSSDCVKKFFSLDFLKYRTNRLINAEYFLYKNMVAVIE